MTRRNIDPSFDPEEIENDDPLGEQMFAEAGFEDAPERRPGLFRARHGGDGQAPRRTRTEGGRRAGGPPARA